MTNHVAAGHEKEPARRVVSDFRALPVEDQEWVVREILPPLLDRLPQRQIDDLLRYVSNKSGENLSER